MAKRPDMYRRREMASRQPLETSAAAWVLNHPVDGAFLYRHLHSPERALEPQVVAALLAHAPAILCLFNDAMTGSIPRDDTRDEPLPSHKKFAERLCTAQDALPEKLCEAIPEITPAQSEVLVKLFSDWRIRMIDQVKRVDERQRTGNRR